MSNGDMTAARFFVKSPEKHAEVKETIHGTNEILLPIGMKMSRGHLDEHIFELTERLMK